MKEEIRSLLMGQMRRKKVLFGGLLKNIQDENPLVCVDVGAALGLKEHWEDIGDAGQYYLIEPGKESARILKKKYEGKSNFFIIEEAISEFGGKRTLKLTNTPTGSTMLEFNMDIVDRYVDPQYLFPMKLIEIETKKLSEILNEHRIERVDLLKIDVQGSEFEVIKGMGSDYIEKLICVEFEHNMHNAYIGQGEFSEIKDYLKNHGLELFDIRLARTYGLKDKKPTDASYFGVFANSRSVSARIWEVDLVFFKDPKELIEKMDLQSLKSLFAAYAIYGYFHDIVRVCETKEAKELIGEDNAKSIIMTTKQIHWLTSRRWFDVPNLFTRSIRKILKITGTGPDWYKVQYCHESLPNS